jgi:ABC-type transport system substrate-binding protein/class 3 adenylate cyclase
MTEPTEPEVEPGDVPSGQVGAGTPHGSATDLRTFLIADIRGYTTYTRENGDEAAAALAERFAQLVEEVVTAREGFVVELRGDEALAVFVSARRALRAAMDLQARFKEAELPRGVGIGLDAGEAIPVGTGYRGTALNLAARLCAAASPGETLASETVIHLAAKVDGIAYVDARALKLKGYGEAVRVVDVVPSEQAKGRRMASGGGRGGPGSRYVLLAGGTIAVLIIAAVVANALGIGPFSPTTGAGSSATPSARPLGLDQLPLLAFYDGSTGALKGTIPFDSPRNIAFFSGGSYWILQENPLSFHRFDAASHEQLGSVTVPILEVSGFNFDDRSLWVTDLAGPRILRIDKATGVADEFTFAEDEEDTAPAHDIAVGDGSVWMSRPDREEITRINAESGEVQARINAVAFGLSYGEGALWYWAEGRLGRIDPRRNELAFDEELELGTVGWLGNINFGGGFAWTAESDAGTLWRIDDQGRRTAIYLEPGIGEIASTPGTIWVTNANTGQLIGVDVITGRHDRVIDTGHATLAVAAGGDELMVAVGATDDEIIGALEGNVLKVSNPYQPWFDPSPDPALNGAWETRQGLYLTCVHLFNYPDKQAPEGWKLEPEAADGMPTVSSDGRTYTFKIKPGFAFSPPSNEAVTAETFRQTIQRTLDPVFDDDAWGPSTLSDIQGVAEYRAGTAQTVTGLVASGDTLSITLDEPSSTLLERLSLSFTCPVPIGTPALRSGLNPTPPVSGAGPYYVASQMRRRHVILKKNPNYLGPRPQPFDAIAIRMSMAPATAIDHVQRGISDAAILPPFEPLVALHSALASEWGPGSANAQAGDQRWFGAPKLVVDFLVLNQTREPFSDPNVRRAVTLALDRDALAEIFAQSPTDDLYLPGMAGAPFPDSGVAEPDVGAALELMGGRTLDVTMQGWPEDWGCVECQNYEYAITDQLSAIGINVTVVRGEEHPGDAFEPESEVDLVAYGTGTDNPDLVSLLGGLRDVSWLGDEQITELDRLEALTGDERNAGALSLVRRLVEEDRLVVPTGYPVLPMYLSERVGCAFVQPAIGAVDLLSLCVKDTE